MSLKIKVKVGEINNLSDARYCAGMGVEMIGFSMEESHAKYLSPVRIAEIANWLTGVQIVGEFDGMDLEQITNLVKIIPLDYIQIDFESVNLDFLSKIAIPIILRIKVNQNIHSLIEEFRKLENRVSYFLLESDDENYIDETVLKSLCKSYNILLGYGVKTENIEHILTIIKPEGISLKGGIEIRPGLKDFEDLSEILELLEVDDYN